MANDMTKTVENSLLELQKHAKEQKAKISDITEFTEKVYVLMLEVLVEIEKLNKKNYDENPENELKHSQVIFHIANPNEDAESYSLVSFIDVENTPKNFNLSEAQKHFSENYLNTIKECNANQKLQRFKIPSIDISTFYNTITMLIKKNTALYCRNDEKATGPNVIKIGLDVG